MRGDSTPDSGRHHHITGTQWPHLLPEGTPGTPVRDRRRGRRRGGLIASLLARLLPPPPGNHHAPPGAPQEDPRPGAVTLAGFTAVRVPRKVPQQGGRHRA